MEEEENSTSKLLNRESLYERFKNGKRPNEKDFEDLINSSINKLDDGISKSFEAGLELAPQGEEGKEVISLYEKLNDLHPAWKVSLQGEKGKKNLTILSQQQEGSALTVSPENKIGINQENPQHDLDISGTIASSGRVGTFASGEVPADGKWKTVLENLEGVNAFELIAVAHATEGKGKYALLQASLLNAYSGDGGRIKRTQDYYSWKWWHRIRVRWRGTPFDYSLEIRSGYDYGEGGVIQYNIGKLL
mgnify:CR=1 FL=1